MAARYVEIPDIEMHTFMQERGFEFRKLKGVHEKTYERDRTSDGSIVVRVYSTIQIGSDDCRDVGTDAIRVNLVWKGPKVRVQPTPPGTDSCPMGTVLYACTRTHRTQGWRTTLDGRMREAWLALKLVKKCPRCEVLPLVERTRKDGGKFLGCIGWKKDGSGCSGTMNIQTRITLNIQTRRSA